ncbi:hypothetical protein [Pseudoalteromonas sp. OOF1S-7]|uniref:hypothetical protein n=1 Tax=Pseudoalteromonas sp. OOF1S-7 TaxID=2917757 RepID=UPI001EF48D46|nr:hypothetical protein [Pseudoalteromonas sp. OOF1S-7]MCG7535332.1 hypothetical protein [Pseudoalteromonas sp. OOF1S-7]
MKHLPLLLTILSVLLLSACNTTPIKQTRINVDQPLAMDQGVIAVQVINNAERLGQWHREWGEVIVARLDNQQALKQAAIAKAKSKAKGKPIDEDKVDWDPDVYTLSARAHGTESSQVFVGAVPEGNYAIVQLYSYYNDGNVVSWISMPVFSSAGEFKVEKGRFTDLGSVVFQPLLNIKNDSFWSQSSKQKAYVTRLKTSAELGMFVREHYANLSMSVDFSDPLGWQRDILDPIRDSLGALSRDNAYGNKAVSIKGADYNAVLAKFGQLRLVSDRRWQQYDLPTDSELLSAMELNGQLLVGSERGQLFEKTAEGWTNHAPVSAKEAIVWMGTHSQVGYALTSSDKLHTIYKFGSSAEQWQQIGQFKKKQGQTFWVQNGGLFAFFNQAGNLNIINDNKLHWYDVALQQWQAKKYRSFKRFTQLKSGVLLGVEVSQWDGYGDPLVSFDYGLSWHKIQRGSSLFSNNKHDTSLAAVLSDGTLVSTSLQKSATQSKRTHKIITLNQGADQASDWQQQGPLKVNCHILLPELTSQNTLYFLCDQGQIVSTTDLGQSWHSEVDINISQMQKQYEEFVASYLEGLKKAESTVADNEGVSE